MQHKTDGDAGNKGDWETWVVESCIPKGKDSWGRLTCQVG